MNASENAAKLVASFEGFSSVAYQDGNGIWTIGFGTTRGVKEGDTCTREDALEWLQRDLGGAAEVIDALVTVPLTQSQFDALCSFVYNVGSGHFSSSTMLKRLNEGDYLGAAAEFIKWDKIAGTISNGLLRRRMAERDLFTKREAV